MKTSDPKKPTVLQRAVVKAMSRIHAQLEKENTQATRPKSSSTSPPEAGLTPPVWLQSAFTSEPRGRSIMNLESSAVPASERTVGDWLAELNKIDAPADRTLFWREHYDEIIYARARENHPNALLLQRKH